MIENPIVWPNGARCAVSFTFDMGADSILHGAHPKDSAARVASMSMLHYGPKVAIPRILETYRRFEMKRAFFIPAWCIEQYPKAIEAIVENGYEIAHHGYIHEHPNELARSWLRHRQAFHGPGTARLVGASLYRREWSFSPFCKLLIEKQNQCLTADLRCL
jgi:peptidoglycan/xylan/chitin deacetylase (PgdA/CDA1 family)